MAPGTCRNLRPDASRCGEDADAYGDHAVECSVGGGTKVRHDAVCDLWAGFAAECGATATREVFVPEWTSRHQKKRDADAAATTEAWLDVHADGIPDIHDFLGDVTVCHPAAVRYQPGATCCEAHAADKRAAEKSEQYVQASGRRLVPLASETWGRLGTHAEEVLLQWAAAANRRDWQRGRAPAQRARRWRCALDASLQQSTARMLLACGFGHALRPCPRPNLFPDPAFTELHAPAAASER